jgi:hypothetical protein
MTPGIFNVKFPYDTQFTFGSLTFTVGEDRNLKMLPPMLAPERLTPVYEQAPYFPTISSISGGVFSGLDPYVRSYIRTVKLIRGIPIVMSILQLSAEASSSSSSAASPDQDSADDYPEIRGSTCGDSAMEGRLIVMVAPAGGSLHDNSSRYPTIGRSEASDARTPNNRMIQNLNLDFNAILLLTIMESIQRMTPEGSPLVALAHQGVETVNYVIAQRLTDNPRGEPSVGNRSNDRMKRARSEAASSASSNRLLADNDVHRRITQNCQF